MTLVDAGPLVALIDRNEADHRRCTDALRRLRGPMLTSWPAFAEALYLLGDGGGWRAQELLWRLQRRGDLIVGVPVELGRVADLIEKYSHVPMDLADATLVAMAEERNMGTVFTLDAHFRVYKLIKGRILKLVP